MCSPRVSTSLLVLLSYLSEKSSFVIFSDMPTSFLMGFVILLVASEMNMIPAISAMIPKRRNIVLASIDASFILCTGVLISMKLPLSSVPHSSR